MARCDTGFRAQAPRSGDEGFSASTGVAATDRKRVQVREREIFIDNLLVRVHLIIEMSAPREFEFRFPCYI